jgi:hypothetical protein
MAINLICLEVELGPGCKAGSPLQIGDETKESSVGKFEERLSQEEEQVSKIWVAY